MTFDKDDEDTLDFVAANGNLRSYIFNIETKSKFDIKGETFVIFLESKTNFRRNGWKDHTCYCNDERNDRRIMCSSSF